jgi:hypothetical protein
LQKSSSDGTSLVLILRKRRQRGGESTSSSAARIDSTSHSIRYAGCLVIGALTWCTMYNTVISTDYHRTLHDTPLDFSCQLRNHHAKNHCIETSTSTPPVRYDFVVSGFRRIRNHEEWGTRESASAHLNVIVLLVGADITPSRSTGCHGLKISDWLLFSRLFSTSSSNSKGGVETTWGTVRSLRALLIEIGGGMLAFRDFAYSFKLIVSMVYNNMTK